MNGTAIIITAIICVTVVAIAYIGKDRREK